MIKLTSVILENNLREYSDKERQKMGIPSGATSRGGVWYVGDKYAGKVVGGKFVPAGKEQPTKPKTTPTSSGEKVPSSDTSKTKTPASSSEPRFGPDTSYLQVRKGATPAERKLVGKVHSMWDKVADNDFITKHMGKSYPSAEFEKMTGIPKDAAKAFTNAVDDYEIPFQYWEEDDTVYVADPMDV